MWKRFLLATRRLFRKAFRGIGFNLSVVFLILSAAVSLMIIAPNCFDRVPIYYYLIREWKLPIAYELRGKVEIVNAGGNVVNKDVEIFVGGYCATVNSNGEFELVFSATSTSEVFVVIRYINPTGQIITKTELIVINSGIHDIEKEFKYNV